MATLAGISFGIYFIQLKITGAGGVTWALTLARIGSFVLAISVCATQATIRAFRPATPRRMREFVAPHSSTPHFSPSPCLRVCSIPEEHVYTLATTVGRLDVAAVISSLYPAGPSAGDPGAEGKNYAHPRHWHAAGAAAVVFISL